MLTNLINYLLARYLDAKIMFLDYGFWYREFVKLGTALVFIAVGLFLLIGRSKKK